MKFKNLIFAAILWASHDCYYFDDALSFLNGLSEQQKETAYIIALNSARSGFMNGYYTVVYRKS
jgi:hypothetical protein